MFVILQDNYTLILNLHNSQANTTHLLELKFYLETKFLLFNPPTDQCDPRMIYQAAPKFRNLPDYFTYIDNCNSSNSHPEPDFLDGQASLVGHSIIFTNKNCTLPPFQYDIQSTRSLTLTSLSLSGIFMIGYVILNLLNRKIEHPKKKFKIVFHVTCIIFTSLIYFINIVLGCMIYATFEKPLEEYYGFEKNMWSICGLCALSVVIMLKILIHSLSWLFQTCKKAKNAQTDRPHYMSVHACYEQI